MPCSPLQRELRPRCQDVRSSDVPSQSQSPPLLLCPILSLNNFASSTLLARSTAHLLTSSIFSLCYASRIQVTYDLSELDSPSLVSLRTSLFDALRIFSVPGSRPILVQVCLALADLAVQMLEWDNVVQGMVEQYGKEVPMVPALLEFLRVLPEEAGNPKIALTVSLLISQRTLSSGRIHDGQVVHGPDSSLQQ